MKTRGFTLVETLVVIAIIAVLAGLLFPVLSSSKTQARKVDNISKMRQLGQAAAMYETRHGEFPLSTVPLVAEGLVPRNLCDSYLDTSRDGLANETSDYESKHLGAFTKFTHADYKNTFIGPGEFGLGKEIFDKYVEPGPSAGWLVDVTTSDRGYLPSPAQWEGRYNRLLTDGAVVSRVHKDFSCYDSGDRKPCRMTVLLFVDPSARFEELQKSDDSESSQPQP